MNYNSCQFLDECLASSANMSKRGHPSIYQPTISSGSPSLSSPSSSSSSSSSPSSLSAQQYQRLEQNPSMQHSISSIQPIDRFYSANRTNGSYYPPAAIDYNSHTYYFVSTHRSIIQQCSDTFFLLTGYSPLELIGKSLADFLHPDDLYHNGHQAGATFPLFIRFHKKNGQILPLKCKKVTNFNQDEVIYIGIANTSSKPATTPSIGPVMTNPLNVSSELQNSSSCCMNSAAITSNFYKSHRDILLRNYVCVDCGTTASPEWRRGPHGPKTLCNACGLRWAKKNKRK